MTNLEIILICIIWIGYGILNAWQHDWHKYMDCTSDANVFTSLNIMFAPVALVVRIVRGVIFWKGKL